MTGRAFLLFETRRFRDADVSGRPLELLVTGPCPSPFRPSRIHELVSRAALERRLDPDEDLVLIAGPQIQVSLAVAWLLARYGSLRLGLFHAREERYVEVLVDRDGEVDAV